MAMTPSDEAFIREHPELKDLEQECKERMMNLLEKISQAAAGDKQALIQARQLASWSSSRASSRNISEVTEKAESAACQLLADALAKALPGHVIINGEGTTNLEVPITTSGPKEEESSGSKTAGIAGLIVGGVLIFCCLIMVIMSKCVKKKDAKNKAKDKAKLEAEAGADSGDGTHVYSEKEAGEADSDPDF
jgi:hypothetical protein